MSVSYPAAPIILEGCSLRFMRQYAVIPIRDDGDGLVVATGDPADLASRRAIELFAGRAVRFEHDDRDRILAHIDRLYGQRAALMRATEVIEEHAEPEGEPAEKELRDQALEAPIIRLVNVLLARAVEMGASDIHLESMERRFVVRMRVDGVLREQESPPKETERAVISRIKLMAHMNIAERRLPQDGRLKTVVLGQEVDLRVATSPGLHGESLVIRLLTRQHRDIALDRLGLSADHEQRLRALIREPNGLLLVTGPTGSGKSTTLYCALRDINDPGKKIITLEDPVEYQLDGVVQIAMRPDIGLSFAKALRNVVRQDPDVIMVGEIRDQETAEIAVQSALTGHLVLSTLHTNDALGAIARLQELGIAPFLLAAGLKGVVAQRLLRRLCPECAKPAPLPEAQRRRWAGRVPAEFLQRPVAQPLGCAACAHTGYRGRAGAFEILPVTPRIAWLMTNNASLAEYQQALAAINYRSLLDDALDKATVGLTTLSEVERVIGGEPATPAGTG
ncbi:MAG: type II/IV secretion system protein [Gammaproteobacteria bacterium]|nr:type II/IV secretion system protein [Gammaproteobacteria bacterium]